MGSRGVSEFETGRGRERLAIVGVSVLSALLFTGGLLLTEAPGELALDIDFKPFVLPYLLIAVVRYGIPTLGIGFGAAMGESALDVVEGYELDDPIGFIGYVVGFTLFGWYLHRVGADPTARRTQVVAAVLGAFGQAVFEGVAFVLFAGDAGGLAAVTSVVGNTLTHGVVLGAIPLVVLYPWLSRYVDGEKIAASGAE